MPNLVPPVKTVEEANAYRERIMAHVPEGIAFDPRMVLYFTNNTAPSEVKKIKESAHVNAIKLYPPARPPTQTAASATSAKSMR